MTLLTTVCTARLVPLTVLCATFFAVITVLFATFLAVRTGPASTLLIATAKPSMIEKNAFIVLKIRCRGLACAHPIVAFALHCPFASRTYLVNERAYIGIVALRFFDLHSIGEESILSARGGAAW